jgi:Mn-dependent DtxR family transcriptional regulator
MEHVLSAETMEKLTEYIETHCNDGVDKKICRP